MVNNFSRLIKYNFLISLVICTLFIFQNSGYSFFSILTTLVGVLSTVSSFYLIFLILTLPFFYLNSFRVYFASFLFLIFNLFLLIDLFIFRLYNTHINAMILDIMFSPAALNSIDLGVIPYIIVGLLIFILIYIQYYIVTKIQKEPFLNKYFLSFLIVIILIDKTIFGFANLYSKTDITEKMRVIPYYQPMSINGFAKKYFGIHPKPKDIKIISKQGARLDYPKKELEYKKDFIDDNILIIMMDSLRWDMIDEDTAPNIYKLKQESIAFENHYSGGNATRFGVFSFFYGLNAPYWFSFLDEQKSSILFDTLEYRNFDVNIFASSDLNWPEFRRTMFSKLNDKIVDKIPGLPWQKDRELNNLVLSYLDKQSLKENPFFSFVFFDAPHQASYPKSHSKFKPDNNGEKNYLTVNPSQREYLFNQYKNSIYYNDMLLGEIIDRLKKLNLYEKTRIIVTADHGEEFFESGSFGHNSSFSKEQIKPLFFMKIPNENPRTITEVTSHIDFVPTIMNWLGVKNISSDYSLGFDLLNKNYTRDYAVVGNWNNNAIVSNGYTLVFSSHPNMISGTKVYETDSYKEVESSISREYSKTVLKVIDENRKFYK